MKKAAGSGSSFNSISSIRPEEYQNTEVLINVFDAISNSIHQGLYVVDYCKKNFLYVSDNYLFLNGYTAEEIKELGYKFYLEHVPEHDLSMLEEIDAAKSDFYEQIPIHDRLKYSITYDFHIKDGNKKTLVNHKLSPVLLTDDGSIRLAICIVTPSTHNEAGHVIMHRVKSLSKWEYSLENHRWEEHEGITLSEREKEVLILSTRGYTVNRIARELQIGVNTIKSYKKDLFDKLQVKNITEALLFARNYKLL